LGTFEPNRPTTLASSSNSKKDDDDDDKNKKNEGEGPPPALAILAVYLILGGVISFGFGRTPDGTMPVRGILYELAPSVLVLCIFLHYYELFDCMGAGIAKSMYAPGYGQTYDQYKAAWSVPHEMIYLTNRAQTNQIEQFPVFLVGTIGCAIYVNGIVAAVIAGLWCYLRIRYSIAYRSSVGLTQNALFRRIGAYTVPAYFCANALVSATAVHAVRTFLYQWRK
jgi:uncharacterized MAPEG superfamily protein